MASNTTRKQADTKPEAKPEGEKKKRTMLTPEQRIAKMEADLAEARERAAKKSQKVVDTKLAERNKLDERIKDLQDKRDAITAELVANGYTGDVAPAEVEQPEG